MRSDVSYLYHIYLSFSASFQQTIDPIPNDYFSISVPSVTVLKHSTDLSRYSILPDTRTPIPDLCPTLIMTQALTHPKITPPLFFP